MPRWSHVSLILLCAMIACRAIDKTGSATSEQIQGAEISPVPDTRSKTQEQASQATSQTKQQESPNCAQPLQLMACCEALTPTCNECREKNQRSQQSWDTRCLPSAEQELDCQKGPPVIACCSDASDTCRSCRESAFATLMSWKTRCGDLDHVRCDRAPPQSVCCSDGSPACDACRTRHRRALADWQQRCHRKPS